MVTPYTMGFLRDNNPRVHNQALQDWCEIDIQGHVSVAYDRKSTFSTYVHKCDPFAFLFKRRRIDFCLYFSYNSHHLERIACFLYSFGRPKNQLPGCLPVRE